MRTILELVRAFAGELGGIPKPSQLVGAVDDTSEQLLALANREGIEFSTRANSFGGWQQLHKEHTFTTDGTNNYALPSDFKSFVTRTFWDGSARWELIGAINAQEKQLLRYGLTATQPRLKFYVRNNRLYLEPTPETGKTIAFDYFSNAWCASTSGTPQTSWQADTDTYLLDEDCFIMGLKWRFLRAKGLDYSQEMIDYTRAVSEALARNGGASDLPLNGRNFNRLLDENNIPDSGFGGV